MSVSRYPALHLPLRLRISLALSLSLVTAVTTSISVLVPAYAVDQATLVGLNNDAVRAINAQNYQGAIDKLEQALKLDPSYKAARGNLAIAYNNYGLVYQANPTEAIKYFHKAAYWDPGNPTTAQNLSGIIRKMGKNPNDFATRVAMGDACRKAADFIGAIVEYGEALKIKDDAAIHERLGDVFRVRDETTKAIEQYKAAAAAADSASVEVKLGQAFQANTDIASAIGAYGRAITMKSDDPDVQDALVAGWEAALKDNPTAPENHIGLGQAFQYKGDFGQAESEYKLAISLSPGRRNPVAEKLLAALPAARTKQAIDRYINMGVDLQAKKQYGPALDSYKRAMAQTQDPKQKSDIFMNMGTAYQAMEDFANAIGAYQQALQFDPSNQAAQQGIKTATAAQKDKAIGDTSKAADDLFKAGNYDGAIAKYQELLKNDPNDPAVHFNIGAAYQLKKDFDNAIVEYNLALSFDPKNKSYIDSLAKCKDLKAQPIIDQALKTHQAKDYNTAVGLYQQALDIVPNNASLWFNMASAQYAAQDYPGATRSYQKALQIDPQGQAANYYFLATIDENNGNGAQARSEYQQYLAKIPTGPYAAQCKARIDALTKNPTATIKIKSEADMAREKEGNDNYTKAVELQRSGSYDQAIALYQKAIDLQPNSADFKYALGTCYQQKGDLDQALGLYQQALGMMPGNADYKKAIKDATTLKAGPLVKQAYDKQTAGDLPAAIDLYNRAIQFDGENGSIYMNLGVAYQASDNFQAAYDNYLKAYQYDKKGCVDCLYFLAQIDENFNRGGQALTRYMTYLQQAPSGQYVSQAKARAQALQANPTATTKLSTQADVKNAQAASDAYNQAVKLQEATNYDQAIPLYQQAISLMPKESAYVYALATCMQAKGDLDGAIQKYNEAIAKAPANQVSAFKQALASAQLAQATPLMDQAVAKHSGGDPAGAIPLYEKGLSIYPNNPHGYTNLAGAYQAIDDFSKAKANYSKAIELDSKNESDNWYFIGLIDENYGQAAAAMGDYGKYLAAKATGSYAADAKARIARLKANPASCQKLSTSAQVKASAQASGAFNDAVALQQANKFDEAIAKYNEAITSTPNEPSYYYSLGTCYQAKEDYDNALKNYEKAYSLNPKEPAYKQVITQLRAAKAAPLVNSAIEKQTKPDASGKFDLAGAIADYEAALKLNDDATTHSYLGTAYQAQGNNQKAMMEYQRALAMDKTLVDSNYYLGTVYEALKQPAKAVEEYLKFTRSAPANNPNMAAVKERLKLLAPGHK